MGVIVGVPSFVATVFQGDTLTLMGGIAAGVIGLGWSIYRSLNDQRFDTILARLDKAEKEASDYSDRLILVNKEMVGLKLALEETSAHYGLLKKRLAVHVCPLAADPNTPCDLPDIIKMTS